jgi:hypothetical protein
VGLPNLADLEEQRTMSELFFARTSDPETSHLAAANLNHMNMKPCESIIYRLLNGRNLTDEELVNEYQATAELIDPKLQRSPSAIRTLRVKMYRDGLLRVVGVGTSSSGHRMRIWTALEL